MLTFINIIIKKFLWPLRQLLAITLHIKQHNRLGFGLFFSFPQSEETILSLMLSDDSSLRPEVSMENVAILSLDHVASAMYYTHLKKCVEQTQRKWRVLHLHRDSIYWQMLTQ